MHKIWNDSIENGRRDWWKLTCLDSGPPVGVVHPPMLSQKALICIQWKTMILWSRLLPLTVWRSQCCRHCSSLQRYGWMTESHSDLLYFMQLQFMRSGFKMTDLQTTAPPAPPAPPVCRVFSQAFLISLWGHSPRASLPHTGQRRPDPAVISLLFSLPGVMLELRDTLCPSVGELGTRRKQAPCSSQDWDMQCERKHQDWLKRKDENWWSRRKKKKEDIEESVQNAFY